MKKDKLGDAENKSFETDDAAEAPPTDIVAFNELRSCADLYRMHTSNILEIKPEFQREIVWEATDQSRFIDSLMKQLPIPSMCFSVDYKTQKWQVIDGLQRMTTIIKFLSGNPWTLSRLDDIEPEISGKSVEILRDEKSNLHHYYTRVENLTLPITVLRCDLSKKSHKEYLFTIFHRLNSGGVRLSNQEIRNCIYSGPFNDFLKNLAKSKEWIRLYSLRARKNRFKNEEIILRFFTFNEKYKTYTGHLSKFLNDYMDEKRNLSEAAILQKQSFFTRTVDIVHRKVFMGVSQNRLSIAYLEAVLVGASFNLEYLEKLTPEQANSLYKKLQANEEFSENKLFEGLSHKDRLIGRLNAAIKIFSGK